MRFRRKFLLLFLSILIIWHIPSLFYKHIPSLFYKHIYHDRMCLFPVGLIKLAKAPLRLSKNRCLSNDGLTAIGREHAKLTTKTIDYRYITNENFEGRMGNLMFETAAIFGIGYALKYKPYISPMHPLVQYFEIPTITDMQLPNSLTLYEDDGGCDVSSCRADIYLHNVTLNGFFQSWKYFHNIVPIIREMFSVRPFYLSRAKQFLESFKTENVPVIGVHVRRGDFITKEYNRKCGYTVADTRYINEAMSLYRRRYKHAIFIMISDDMIWCKKNIVNYDVLYSEFTEPILDLALMTLCDHMIITGGTFGWWGAWLAGGEVVYLKDFPRPGSWLDVFGMDKEEYYPSNWIGLNGGSI